MTRRIDMKKIITAAFFMLSALPAFAADTGRLDMEKLNVEMDKAASRASISLACGATGKKMVQDLTSSLRPTYESIDYIGPKGFDIEKALSEVTAPLKCKNTVLKEIRYGYLSVEEALVAASRAD